MRKAILVLSMLLLSTAVMAEPVQKPVTTSWVDRPKEERARFIEGWCNLPETTRPPFPAYPGPAAARPFAGKSQPRNR